MTLSWPPTVPRTPALARQQGAYHTSWTDAVAKLKRQVRLLVGKGQDPRTQVTADRTHQRPRPGDPGVVAWFVRDNRVYAFPCDRWLKPEQNLQAIVLTIDALRGIARHGAEGMVQSALHGFESTLPPPAVPITLQLRDAAR